MSHHDDPLPLVTLSMQNQSERLAIVRSIRRESTDLGPRAFRRLILLLESLAGEHFSDGHQTEVRVSVLAKSLRCNRSTIHRSLADASALGLIHSESRYGTVGQQISSRRVLDWRQIRRLAGRDQSTATTAIPPSQLQHPRRNCDTPVATATPCITDSPDTTETNKRSGLIPDQKSFHQNRTRPTKDQRRVEADIIARQVRTIFDRLGYRKADGWVFWSAMAAVHNGDLSAADIGRTVDACQHSAGGLKGPGYFRRVLADKAGMTAVELNTCLKRCVIVWGRHQPGAPPIVTSDASPSVRFNRPPPKTDTTAHEKKTQILQSLAEITS
ncbi:hypothetical protein [Roseiconus lacunae]|uniref:Helix-turn-helix domain-containing protein n=1 Tax=Roseiconus lacunae TaxID=2605694 RepID=A0ABT7PHP5_9BACT|nr:hypothetical protein [Roseiconus lacunae]MDM4015814.1 hypothetical protein [Roseiconus lacunae]